MATSAAKVIQTVRSHIPLIQFPSRKAVTLGFPPTSTPVSATSNIVFSAPQSSAGLLPSYEKPVGSTARGSGIDFKDLPPRFRRKLIDQQEIEYIERGGPA